MEGRFAALGLSTTRLDAPFDRYVTDSTLTADGVEVDHLPFFYEWTGSIDTTDVEVVLADAHAGGRDHDLDHTTDAAATAALVIATEHPDGSLVAVNRRPGPRWASDRARRRPRPARLNAAETVRLRLDARIEPALTTNLEACNGLEGPQLLITTPLTGWFGCAGERGTGVAVLLDLLERFADRPLLVLATGGHELDYLGVRQWVGARRAEHGEPPVAVIHVGASIAVDEPADDGSRHLIPTRLAMTDASGETAERIRAALEPAAFIFRPETESWLGESEVFCDLDVPMLSFTGSGIAFHTPEDTTAQVTSAASLTLVADGLQTPSTRCSTESEISRPGRSGRCRRRNEAPHMVGVRNEGRVPEEFDRTAHVVVRVAETAGGPLRDDAVLGFEFGSKLLFDHAAHAALRVVEQDDLAGTERTLGKTQRANDVVGDDPARIADDVAVAGVEPQDRVDVHPRVHAGNDRDLERRRRRQTEADRRRRGAISGDKVVGYRGEVVRGHGPTVGALLLT